MFDYIGTTKEIPIIEKESVGGIRYYCSPDGKQYPSMTSILATQDKPQIKAWIERVGKKEADRIRISSATRGTILHSSIENYLHNYKMEDVLIKPYESITEEMANMNTSLFTGIQRYIDKINNIHALEIPLWSDIFRWAGTADCIAEYNGDLSLIDFKTSLRPKPEKWLDDYFMQISGYSQMYKELTGDMVKQGVIIMANEENPKEPQVFIKKWQDCKPFLVKLNNVYKRSGLK